MFSFHFHGNEDQDQTRPGGLVPPAGMVQLANRAQPRSAALRVHDECMAAASCLLLLSPSSRSPLVASG